MDTETEHQPPCIRATLEMLPLEILALIPPLLLETEDLRHFRLACHKTAEIGRHLIPRYGLVIPRISTISEQLAAIHPDIIKKVKSITLFSCRWNPLPNKAEWVDSVKSSDLFEPEKLDGLSNTIDEVYMDTKRFVAAQCDADSVAAAIITRAVESFPNLEAIIPTYLPSWHTKPSIRRALTGIFAFPNRGSICPPLDGILRGLSGSYTTKIRCLNLSRHTPAALEYFKPLNIGALGRCSIECIHLLVYERVGHGMNDEFPERRRHELSDVLQLFPDLRKLHIEVKRKQGAVRMGRGYMDQLDRIIGDNVWHQLESVYLSCIWCTEDQLYEFLENHASTLKGFGLGEVYLLDGVWSSFFRRLGNLMAQRLISLRWLRLDGKLGGCRDFFLYDIDKVSFFSKALPLQLLANYLGEISTDWSLVQDWEEQLHVEQLPGLYGIRISESAYEVVEEPMAQSHASCSNEVKILQGR